MGRTAFTAANKAPSTGINTSDLPKLSLAKDEKARIIILEDPVTVWQHRLQMPKIINGTVQKVEKERRNGGTYSDYDWEFISAPRCMGKEDILSSDAADPENCPMCREAQNGLLQAPKRRHAMTIVQYGTKKNGDVIQPFSASVKAWVFADSRFEQILAIAEGLKEGASLSTRDLVLGPCSDPVFQKFDVTAQERCAYLELDKQEYITALFEGNKFSEAELQNLAAWESSKLKIEQELSRIRACWDIVNGAQRPEPSSATDAAVQSDNSLKEELAGLLDSQTGGMGAAASGDPLDEFTPKTTPKASSGALSFDDLTA